jgi:hypothetical protein
LRRGGKKADKGASSSSLEFLSVEEIQDTLKQAVPSLTGTVPGAYVCFLKTKTSECWLVQKL